MNANQVKRLLSDIEVEQAYGFPKAKTLRKWRLFGTGPQYIKAGGSVRYDIRDLEAFFSSCKRGGPGTVPRIGM